MTRAFKRNNPEQLMAGIRAANSRIHKTQYTVPQIQKPINPYESHFTIVSCSEEKEPSGISFELLALLLGFAAMIAAFIFISLTT